MTDSRIVFVALLVLCGARADAQEDARSAGAGAAGGSAAVEETADEPLELSAWMTGFHRAPDPDRVAWAIGEMSRKGTWQRNGQMAVAFLAEVFRQYPERVAAWARLADGRSEDERHWILLAVWMSEVPRTVEILRAAAAKETGTLREALERYVERTPAPVLELPLTSPERLDMLWASYFASGNAAYVERLTTALEPSADDAPATAAAIRGAARWSLGSNARQHDDVREILHGLHARADGAVRDELAALLEQAKPKTPEGGAGSDG